MLSSSWCDNGKLSFYLDENKTFNVSVDFLNLESQEFIYTFSLFRDRKKVDEKRWCSDSLASFKDFGNGVYFAQVEIKSIADKTDRIVLRSSTIANFEDSYKKSVLERLKSLRREDSLKISFEPSKEPFCDFIYICLPEGDGVDVDMSTLSGFDVHYLTETKREAIITNGSILESNGVKSILSGFLFKGDGAERRIINCFSNFVSEDILDVGNEIGTYSLFRYNGESAEFYNDFHASSKLYTYSVNGKVLVSNRYHLIIKLLEMLGCAKVNVPKVIATLATAYNNIFSHNFMTEGMLCELNQLYTGKNAVVKNGILSVVESDIHQLISIDEAVLLEEDYKFLLDKAADEVVANIDAVAKCECYTDIVVDLSGGVDSRVVYAALTNANIEKERVSINIRKTKDPLDHVTAIKLNQLFGYSYYRGKNKVVSELLSDEEILSYTMESKYFMPIRAKVYSPNTILCNGFYGEPSLRRRGSNGILVGSFYEYSVKEVSKFVDLLFSTNMNAKLIVDYEKYGHFLKELYSSELEATPGINLVTKLENHYLNYSHAYHASESFRPGIGTQSVSVIKSKFLFKLYRESLAKIKGRELSFDFVHKLNPIIALMPYSSDSYNNEMGFLKQSYFNGKISPSLSNFKPEYDVDVDSWLDARNELQKNKKTEKIPNFSDDAFNAEMFLSRCVDIMPEVFEDLAVSLYHFIQNNKDEYIEINTLKNKLSVIVEHLSLHGSSRM